MNQKEAIEALSKLLDSNPKEAKIDFIVNSVRAAAEADPTLGRMFAQAAQEAAMHTLQKIISEITQIWEVVPEKNAPQGIPPAEVAKVRVVDAVIDVLRPFIGDEKFLRVVGLIFEMQPSADGVQVVTVEQDGPENKREVH